MNCNKLLSYFTLLSFSVSLAWLILAIIIESPLRGTGERWDVSWGGGLMVYWTLGVHLTEKKSVPGGAHLGEKHVTQQCRAHLQTTYYSKRCQKQAAGACTIPTRPHTD